MNTSLLKKNISNIILSKSNSNISFFTTKKSFLDKNFSSLNDVFLEINKISEKDKTPGLLNLCGVARMLSDKSNDVIRLAIKDFKNSCLKETVTEKF